MKYKSTRGGEAGLSASQAILQGIAKDGGLFVPEAIPQISKSLEELSKLTYNELAYEILRPYLTDYDADELRDCITKAYDDKFDTEEITPVVKKGDDIFLLELFHGKTLAFKDIALSLLPYLLRLAAKKNNMEKEIVIITATSGDTGKAALEAFKDVEGTRIIVLYPENGVSIMQETQMVTQEGRNTSVFAIKGNFDDAQTAVKEIFLDRELGEKLSDKGFVLSSANSINIGRLLPQIVYYFYAYFCLVKRNELKIGDPVNFVVPTGNFGDILAGYYAKKMGLPVNLLVCASNINNVLFEFFRTKKYDANRPFIQTMAPSIDILISSNLERLLYDVRKDTEAIKALMGDLKNAGKYIFKEDLADFRGYFSDEKETSEAIKRVFEQYGYVLDTHTAVAYSAYEKFKEENSSINEKVAGNEDSDCKTVILSTASPYKFTKSVMSAIDEKYAAGEWDDFRLIDEMNKLTEQKTPPQIAALREKEKRHTGVLEKDTLKERLFEEISNKNI